MMTPDWQGDAVNGVMADLVSGRALKETGITLGKDYMITLPLFITSLLGTFH